MKRITLSQALTDIEAMACPFWSHSGDDVVQRCTLIEYVQEYVLQEDTPCVVEGSMPIMPSHNVDDKAKMVLNCLIERLDEDHWHEDAAPTDVTDPMMEAARVFVRAIQAEYQPTMLAPVIEVEVTEEDVQWARAK